MILEDWDIIATMAASPRDPAHDEFLCVICSEFLEVPVRTHCNHLFCKDCLLEALRVNPACPFCRVPTSTAQYSIAQNVDEKMRTTTLNCHRCNQTFRPINGRAHDAECVEEVSIPRGRAANPLSLGVEVNRFVFPCAYCGSKNFSREGLVAHCNTNHKTAPNHKLVCTICVAFPWGSKDKVSGHLLDHLNMRHQFDYDRFVDLHEDEEASLHAAMQASVM